MVCWEGWTSRYKAKIPKLPGISQHWVELKVPRETSLGRLVYKRIWDTYDYAILEIKKINIGLQEKNSELSVGTKLNMDI